MKSLQFIVIMLIVIRLWILWVTYYTYDQFYKYNLYIFRYFNTVKRKQFELQWVPLNVILFIVIMLDVIKWLLLLVTYCDQLSRYNMYMFLYFNTVKRKHFELQWELLNGILFIVIMLNVIKWLMLSVTCCDHILWMYIFHYFFILFIPKDFNMQRILEIQIQNKVRTAKC